MSVDGDTCIEALKLSISQRKRWKVFYCTFCHAPWQWVSLLCRWYQLGEVRTELLSEHEKVFRLVTEVSWLFSVAFLATEFSMSEEKAKPGWILTINNVLRAWMKCTFSSALTPLINMWVCETKWWDTLKSFIMGYHCCTEKAQILTSTQKPLDRT